MIIVDISDNDFHSSYTHRIIRPALMSSEQTEFEDLIDRYSTHIGAAVRRVCLQRYESLIPDVTQEVHIALWKIVNSGKKIDNPPSYIYKVALTTGLAVVERAKKQWLIARDLTLENPASSAQDAKLAERARLIEELLALLPPDQSDALRAYLAGYNHVDIAKLFGWTESVARHKVYRCIDKLRDFMLEHETDEVTEGG